ncbi:MAG TPA: hypothetical protein VL574_11620 [Stellaceae bacterium]|jgi:hypothetical protein|nr:hypothetical protein [Stellaceae bacterium]
MAFSNGIRRLIKLNQQERRLVGKFERAKAVGDFKKMLRASRLLVAVQDRVIDLAKLDHFLE